MKNIKLLLLTMIFGIASCLFSNEHEIVPSLQTQDENKEIAFSSHAQKVQLFLENVEVDDVQKQEIINYFKSDQAGYPVCMLATYETPQPQQAPAHPTQDQKPLLKKFFKTTLEIIKKLFNITTKDIEGINYYWHNNYKTMREIDSEDAVKYLNLEIFPEATELVKNIKSKVPVTTIYKLEDYVLNDGESKMFKDTEGNLVFAVKIHEMWKDNPEILQWVIGHELSHLEKLTSFYNPLPTFLAVNIIGNIPKLIGTLFILPYTIASWIIKKDVDSSFITNNNSCLSNQIRGFFQRKEELWCDKRSVEMIGTTKGFEQWALANSNFYDKFSGPHWKIAEIKTIAIPLEEQQKNEWRDILYSPEKTMNPSNKERYEFVMNNSPIKPVA